MGFLKKFFRNVFRDGMPTHATSSFDRLTDEELEAHLGVVRYGDFVLTGAVRPSYDLQVIPCQGYRHDIYRDEENKSTVPVLMGAASQEQLFEVFMETLDPLGPEVDVVLETSHDRDNRGHVDLYREHIDMPVLKSILWDFEDCCQRRMHGHCRAEPRTAAGSPIRRAQAADRIWQQARTV